MATPKAPKPPEGHEPRWWGPELDGYPLCTEDRRLAALVAPVLGVSFRATEAQLKAQTTRPRYLLVECLGRGQAEVYRAIDRLLERVVVVKIYATADGLDEARLIARARHPNVIEVHEVGVHDGQLFIVLEWCEGTTLLDWCREQPWREVLAKILEAGAGLERCHALGIVHGDIKPNNILITGGRAVLADFGLAGSPGFEPFGLGGTVCYMAPEVFDGRRRRSNDVYSLACTAWVCLFGELPFPGKTLEEVLLRAERPPAQPRWVPVGMRGELLDQIAYGMNPNPKRRPSLATWLENVANAADDGLWRRRVLRSVVNAAILVVLGLMMTSDHEAVCVADPVPTEVVAVAPVEVAEPEPTSVDEQEIGISRAIELVEAGEILRAWEVYIRTQDKSRVTKEERVDLALAFIIQAEDDTQGEPGERLMAATFAKELAAAKKVSIRPLTVVQKIQIENISLRATKIITRYK